MRVLFVIFILPLTIYSQGQLPYKKGEYSAFNISYRGIKVGSAELEILNQIRIDSTMTFHIVGRGKTSPFFDFFLFNNSLLNVRQKNSAESISCVFLNIVRDVSLKKTNLSE